MTSIVIIANFCRAFDGKVDGRFLFLAEELCKEPNVQVELITSSFSHGTKKQKPAPKQEAYKTKITYCYEPGYIRHAGLKRLWSHRVWGKNVAKYVNSLPKPDCIYCAIPSLTAAVKMAKYCKKNNIKFIIDVQDLWPEATFMLIKNKFLRKFALPMAWYVNKAYKAADSVVAVSQTYIDRVMSVNTRANYTLNVFLGNNGEIFERVLPLKTTLNRNSCCDKSLIICYIGTLSYSYDIKCVIDALNLVNNQIEQDITFLVLGDGPLRNEFEEYAMEKQVKCEFTGRLPYEQMVRQMCSCDILINPIVKDAAQSITNKVGDYALSGLPVINTQECQEYRSLIDKYKCGINCEVGNAHQVANAIIKLVKNPELRYEMGKNHRQLGIERFDRRNSYKSIVKLILNQ